MTTRGRQLRSAALLLAAVAAIRAYLEWAGPFPGDRWALKQFGGRALGRTEGDLTLLFAVLGSPVIAIPATAVAVWFVWRSAGRTAATFTALASAGVLANSLLKQVSGTTPLMGAVGDPASLHFPSGHTFFAVVLAGAVAWVAARSGRRDITALLVVLAALMGPSRILLNAHHLSDVVAGYLAGGAWLLFAAALTGWPAASGVTRR